MYKIVNLTSLTILFVVSVTGLAEDWQDVSPPGVGIRLECVYFINAKEGWVGGDNFIFHTKDGGITWEEQNVGLRPVDDIHFVNPNIGWAVGGSYTILHTEDGGKNWKSQNWNRPGQSGRLRGVHFVNEKEGWILGWKGGVTGLILHTQNSGKDWKVEETKLFGPEEAYFISPEVGWVIGWNGDVILHTQNNGSKWHEQKIGVRAWLDDIYFVNPLEGWAVGHTDDNRGLILHTNDGGRNWKKQDAKTNLPLYGVYFGNSRVGWAVGFDFIGGVILNTTNGGKSWHLEKNVKKWLFDIHAAGHHLWVVGDDGIVMKKFVPWLREDLPVEPHDKLLLTWGKIKIQKVGKVVHEAPHLSTGQTERSE